MKKKAMTSRQQRFVAEYAVLGDAGEAALRAGYSERTAQAQGRTLLRRAEVARAVACARGDAQAHDEVTRQWVVARLKEVAERCMQAAPVPPARGAAGDAAPQYKFDAGAAIRALNLLGKTIGMFSERDTARAGEHEKTLEDLE